MMATMKFAILVVLVLYVQSAQLQGKCGPNTEVCLASTTDAVGSPVWGCTPSVDGVMVPVTEAQSDFGAKVCGPGKFYFSPMQCTGGRFEYKKQTEEFDDSEVTTGCTVVKFKHTTACYTVEC